MQIPDVEMMTPAEAAEKLGISRRRVSKLFEDGLLRGIKIGEGHRGMIFITKASVQERLENPVKPGRKRLSSE